MLSYLFNKSINTFEGRRLIPVEYSFLNANAAVWTNMPLALTEIFGVVTRRQTLDLLNADQFRIIVNIGTAGVAGSIIGIQYSLDGGTTWKGLDNGTAGSISTLTQVLTSTGSLVTAYGSIAVEARINSLLVRAVGKDGDGVVDPAFNTIAIQVRHSNFS